MLNFLTSPLFYIFMTVGIYFLFAFLRKKTKLDIFNPLLWSIIFIASYILFITFMIYRNVENENLSVEVNKYEEATFILDLLLSPVTVALAIPLYINRHLIKENWLPIIVATIVGVGSSFLTVYLLGLALGIDQSITFAMLPRGVTTAIAKDVASILGVSEQVSITISMVVLTGVIGATLGPLLIKLFHDKDDIVVGLSLGSSSHAIGTSKAFEYSEKAGSIATISIITNGLLTVLLSLIITLASK